MEDHLENCKIRKHLRAWKRRYMRQNRLDSKRTELLSTRLCVHLRAFVRMYAYVGVSLVGFHLLHFKCIHLHHHNHNQQCNKDNHF